MEKLKLMSDEYIVFELEADFWDRGNNPLQKALGNIFRVAARALGYRVHGSLVVTNRRVFEMREEYRCYVFPVSRTVRALTQRGIREIGWEMRKTCGLFWPAYFLFYESETQSTVISIQNGSDEMMMDYLEKFMRALR